MLVARQLKAERLVRVLRRLSVSALMGLSAVGCSPAQPVVMPGLQPGHVADKTTSAYPRREVDALLRQATVVALARVRTATPATFDAAKHSGTAEHTTFDLEKTFKGSGSTGSLDLVCICSPEHRPPPVNTEVLLFARFDPKAKVWLPAGDPYMLPPDPALLRLVADEVRRLH